MAHLTIIINDYALIPAECKKMIQLAETIESLTLQRQSDGNPVTDTEAGQHLEEAGRIIRQLKAGNKDLERFLYEIGGVPEAPPEN